MKSTHRSAALILTFIMALSFTACDSKTPPGTGPSANDDSSFSASIHDNITSVPKEEKNETEHKKDNLASHTIPESNLGTPQNDKEEKPEGQRNKKSKPATLGQTPPAPKQEEMKVENPTPTPGTNPFTPPSQNTDETEHKLVPIIPIVELTHTDGKCDLSEYATGFRTTTEHEVYETERFFVDIEAGCTVPSNLDAHLDKCIRFAEEITGLSLDSEYGKKLYGDKITIYITKDYGYCGPGKGIPVNQYDTIMYNGYLYSFIQAAVQCLEERNGIYLGDTLTSGYKAYILGKAKEKAYLPYLFDSGMNYSYFEQEITADNAEALFETLADWDAVLYGYRLLTYLHAQYGDDIYIKILNLSQESKGHFWHLTPEEITAMLKEVTSETVFEDFGAWYQRNKAQFDISFSITDMTGYSHIPLFPWVSNNTDFSGFAFHITDYLTMDLKTWREYAATQYGTVSYTLQGSFHINGTGTVAFYNSRNELIQSYDLTNEYKEFTLEDVDYIRVTGDNLIFYLNADYLDRAVTPPPEEPDTPPIEDGGDDGDDDNQGDNNNNNDNDNPTIVPFEPIVIIDHGDGKCDLSEYVQGFRTTTEHEVYETERFIVDIEAGCTIPVNLNALLDQCIQYTESLTGLSLDAEYGKQYYGNKITITITKNYDAFGHAGGIQISQYDTVVYGGGMWVIIHEMTHCLEQRNGTQLNTVLTEGHSTYVSRIAENSAYLPYLFHADSNYSNYNQEVTAENAESLFLTLTDWDAYLYGYRLSCYLHTQYGEAVYHNLLKKATELTEPYQELTPQELADILKEVTSPTVFADFAAWYNTNIEQFNFFHSIVDVSRFSRVLLFPMATREFTGYDLQVADTLSVDFSIWRDYVAMQHNWTTNTLQGTISITGTATLDFYNGEGTLIQTNTVTDECLEISLQDVDHIQVTGNNVIFHYELNYLE